MRLHRLFPRRRRASAPPPCIRVLAHGRELPVRLERAGRRRWVARVRLSETSAKPCYRVPAANTTLGFRIVYAEG